MWTPPFVARLSPVVQLVVAGLLLAGLTGWILHGVFDKPRPEAPTEVVASQGESSKQVALSWSPVGGARAYRIYRDGESVGETERPSFIDETSAPGGRPAPPEVGLRYNLEGDVSLFWSESRVPEGRAHAYEVRAIGDGDESSRSEPTAGYRAGDDVDFYEMRIDDGQVYNVGDGFHVVDSDPAGQLDVSPLMAASYRSLQAPQLGFETVDASFDEDKEGVRLSADPVVEVDETPTYELRAVNDVGRSAFSEPVSTRIAAGETQLQWQISEGNDEDFSPIPGATEAEYVDDRKPGVGEVVYYRLKFDAEYAEPVVSEPVEVAGPPDPECEWEYRDDEIVHPDYQFRGVREAEIDGISSKVLIGDVGMCGNGGDCMHVVLRACDESGFEAIWGPEYARDLAVGGRNDDREVADLMVYESTLGAGCRLGLETTWTWAGDGWERDETCHRGGVWKDDRCGARPHPAC